MLQVSHILYERNASVGEGVVMTPISVGGLEALTIGRRWDSQEVGFAGGGIGRRWNLREVGLAGGEICGRWDLREVDFQNR